MTAYSAGTSINKRGSSIASATEAAGTQTLIAAGANVNGLLIRTALLYQTPSATGSAYMQDSDAVAYLLTPGANMVDRLSAPILIPPGKAVSYVGSSTGGSLNISYDIL
jgi:hypothetical protein